MNKKIKIKLIISSLILFFTITILSSFTVFAQQAGVTTEPYTFFTLNSSKFPVPVTTNKYIQSLPDGTSKTFYQRVDDAGKPLFSQKTNKPVLFREYSKTTIGEDGKILQEATGNYLESDQFKDGIIRKQIDKQVGDKLKDLFGKEPDSGNPPTADQARQELENKNKCPVGSAGQSEVLGDMWGEKGVAKPESDDPRPLNAAKEGQPNITKEYAEDIDGNIAGKRVSPENWKFYNKHYGVTDEKSFNKLTSKGQADPKIAVNGKSNQKHTADTIGGGFSPNQVQTPDRQGHMDVLNGTYRNNAYIPPGSSMPMQPRSSYVAGQKTQSAKASGGVNDTDVSDDCKFSPANPDVNPATGSGGSIFDGLNNSLKNLFGSPKAPSPNASSFNLSPSNLLSPLTASIPKTLPSLVSGAVGQVVNFFNI